MFRNSQDLAEKAIAHIPGDLGPAKVGFTQRMVEDTFTFMRESVAQHGHVYKVRTVLDTYVAMQGPEALEFVLHTEKNRFSSEQGWKPNLERLFPGAVMMMDMPQHRIHRKLMAAAFTRPALNGYLAGIVEAVTTAAADWRRQDSVSLFDEIKALFLTISLRTFFGATPGEDVIALNDDMQRMTAAVVFPEKYAWPFSNLGRALRARKRVVRFIRKLIAQKRATADTSMLSHFCHAMSDGEYSYTDDDIVNHMAFMIMASHDTTTSLATSMTVLLAAHPEWAGKIREEISSIPENDVFALIEKEALDCVFREVLRLYPPVPAIPRVATEDIPYNGLTIPKGARVAIYPCFNHRDARYWTNPDAFDPTRFARKENEQHRYMFTPFGAGAHTCLGLVFAELVVKAFTATLLRNGLTLTQAHAWSAEHFWMFPFPRPRADVRIRLTTP